MLGRHPDSEVESGKIPTGDLKHLCRTFAVDGEGPVGGDSPVNVEGTVGGDSYVELEQLVDAALRWWVSVGGK